MRNIVKTLTALAIIFPFAASAAIPFVWEDTSEQGEPISTVKIGDLLLGNRILSGSKFTLRQDSLCEWEYDFGFRALPIGLDGRDALSIYPWKKPLHDPSPSCSSIFLKDDYQTRLQLNRQCPAITYPLDFGPDFKAVGILVRPWAQHNDDGTGRLGTCKKMQADKRGEMELEIAVSSDPEGKKVVASEILDGPKIENFRSTGDVYLPLSGFSKFFVSIRLRKGDSALLAGGDMKVFLRHGTVTWPEAPSLSAGGNYTVGPAPSTVVWPGFEGNLDKLKFNCSGSDVSRIAPGSDSYLNDAGTLKISGKKWQISFPVPESIRTRDDIKAVRIVYRVPTWAGTVLTDGQGTLIRPHPLPQPWWQSSECRISVNGLNELKLRAWGPSWSRDGSPCLEIGSIELINFLPGEKERLLQTERDKIAWDEANQGSPLLKSLREQDLPAGKQTPLDTVFARGIWGFSLNPNFIDLKKSGCRDVWELRSKLLDDLKSHHLNAIHVRADSVSADDFKQFVKLAAGKGICVWGFLSYDKKLNQELPDAENRKIWEQCMVKFRDYLETYARTPNFLAWAVGEEPYEFALPYLAESRELARKMEAQPQVMIYNNGVITRDAAASPFPGGVAMDCYPFMRFTNVSKRYLSYLEASHKAAESCGGVAWFVPQMQGGPGPFTAPTQGEMRFQIWSALAWGITGFFPWPYSETKNSDLSDKPQYVFYAEEMRKVKAMEKLLLDLKLDKSLKVLDFQSQDKVLIGNFTCKSNPDRNYAIVVHLDTVTKHSMSISPIDKSKKIAEETADGSKPVTAGSSILFEAGEGKIFSIAK